MTLGLILKQELRMERFRGVSLINLLLLLYLGGKSAFIPQALITHQVTINLHVVPGIPWDNKKDQGWLLFLKYFDLLRTVIKMSKAG